MRASVNCAPRAVYGVLPQKAPGISKNFSGRVAEECERVYYIISFLKLYFLVFHQTASSQFKN